MNIKDCTPEYIKLEDEALKQVVELRGKFLEEFIKLVKYIHEGTPQSITYAANIEYELTGDMAITSPLGEALGVAQFCDCNCAEEQDSQSEFNLWNEVPLKHLEGCKYYGKSV